MFPRISINVQIDSYKYDFQFVREIGLNGSPWSLWVWDDNQGKEVKVEEWRSKPTIKQVFEVINKYLHKHTPAAIILSP